MDESTGKQREVRVWDLPLRIFHWVLLLLVAGSFITEWRGDLELHAKIGYSVLTLLVFRVVWGFVGGTHARFGSFVKGPSAIRDYLSGKLHGSSLGHNPLGALSVIGLLLVLIAQAVTGLFTTTDEFFQGPLNKLISAELGEKLTEFHEFNSNVLWILVGLHVAAILYYRFVKRDNLVSPMLTGRKKVPADSAATDSAGGGLVAGIVVLAVAAGIVWYLVTRL